MFRQQYFRIGLSLIVALFLWTVSGVKPAAAAPDAICTSTGTGTWNIAARWSCGHVPVAADDVIIAAGHTVTLNTSPVTILSLTVNGTLNMNATAFTSRTMTVSGAVTINSAGTITLSDVNGANTHTLNIGGNFVNNGSYTAINGDVTNVVFNGSSNQTVSGTGATNNFNRITVNNTGAADNNIVEITSTNFTAGTDFLTLTDGILKLSSSFTLSNDFFNVADYTIPAAAGLWLNNPNVTVNAQNRDITINGLLRITAGTYNIGTGIDDDLRYNSGAVFIMEGGALNIDGKFRGDTPNVDTITFSMSGGTLTAPVDANDEDSVASFDIGNASSSFTMSGGTIIVAEESTAGTPLDYLNVAGTVNVTGGTVQFGDNGSPASETYVVGGTAGTTNLPNVVLNQTNPPTVTLNRPANIVGSLTINTGSTLNANGQALGISGNWTNNGTFTSGVQTTTFNGTAAQTISGSSVTGFSTWVVNSGATVVVPDTNIPTAAVAVTNNGTLQQTRTVNNANVQFLTISTDRYRGVDINTTGTAANLGAVTVSVRGNSGLTCPNAGGASPVYALRCFDITPTTQGAAAVTLWATTAEQNGILTSNLTAFRFSSSWEQLTNVTNGTGSNNYVFATGDTPGFSSFLLGDSGFSPTAITLEQVGIVQGMSWLWVVLTGLLLLISAAWWLRGRNA